VKSAPSDVWPLGKIKISCYTEYKAFGPFTNLQYLKQCLLVTQLASKILDKFKNGQK